MSNLIPAVNLTVDPAALVQHDRVHTSLYTDPALFDAELQKIFHSTWVWVAHDSEVPDAGSYKTTFIGKQPVIVVRDRKKAINVLLNRCRHRGATVCEHKKGKTNSFVCPYHGWGYALDGSLRGIPHPESYGDCIDKAELPLVSLRTESYAGMVFATFKDDIEPLEDFLGAARKWMDLFMKQGAGYGIKVPGEHRFRFPGNWKIQLENTTDAYHFPLVHKSFLSSVDEQTLELFDFVKGPGYVEDLGNGWWTWKPTSTNRSRSASRPWPPSCATKASTSHKCAASCAPSAVRASTSTCSPTSPARWRSSACCSRSR